MRRILADFKIKYENFKEVFATDTDKLRKNLIHGYVCTFSIIL